MFSAVCPTNDKLGHLAINKKFLPLESRISRNLTQNLKFSHTLCHESLMKENYNNKVFNAFFVTCMATGKSFWASGGKKTSTAFFWNGVFPEGGLPTSIMCNFPPCTFLTAKQNNVESAGLFSMRNLVNAAAWPSMGWLTWNK